MSIRWDFLRIAVFYGPVWLMIVIIFSIYIYAGKEIFQKRSQLRSFNVPPPFPILENPFVSCKTTEIKITSELADLPTLNASQISFKMDPNGRIQSTQGYDQYSVTIETTPRPSPARPTASAASSHDTTYHHRTAAMEANTAAWSYTKCALLFFASLLITWVRRTLTALCCSTSNIGLGAFNGQSCVLSRPSRSYQLPSQLRLCSRAPATRVVELRCLRYHLFPRD